MKNVFYYYGSFLEKAEMLRNRNDKLFSIKAMDEAFHAMLDKYIPKFATETKLVLPKLKKIEMKKPDITPMVKDAITGEMRPPTSSF